MSAEKAMNEKQGRRRRRKIEEEPPEIEQIGDDEEDEARGLSERKGRATPGRRAQIEVAQTGNFITRPLRRVLTYLEDVRAELGKVTWPTREETLRLTRIVLATTIVSALILGIISLLYTELFRIGLDTPLVLLVVILLAAAVTVWYIRANNRGSAGY